MNRMDRHWQAARRVVLPGNYDVLRLGGTPVGYLRPEHADILRARGLAGETMDAADPAILRRWEAALAGAGVFAPRDEDFDIRASSDGPPLGRMDRGALPVFGIEAQGVHVNGLVPVGAGGWLLWVARRSATKKLDPAKLDHIVAGGIPAGLDAMQTLLKEAEEEASMPPELARRARPAGMVSYAIERPEGLRRDLLWCYDLVLPPDWTPVPRDGEVEAFVLMPLSEVQERARDTDDFKFNVNLVLARLFERLDQIQPDRDRSGW